MSNNLTRLSDLDTEGVTAELVRVQATRRMRQAAEISEKPAAPGLVRAVLQKLGVGPEAQCERQIREDNAKTQVQAALQVNQTLLAIQKAVDEKNVEVFKNQLATLHNAKIREGWGMETAAALHAFDELAAQIDRAEERVTTIRSPRVRKAVLDDVFFVYERMRTKQRSLLPSE